MPSRFVVLVALMLLICCGSASDGEEEATAMTEASRARIKLPAPERRQGEMTLERALERRRSIREFTRTKLADEQIAQLCWAAQGISGRQDRRTSPSAGALYPLELYVALPEGLFHYRPKRHELRRIAEEDFRPAIYDSSLKQDAILEAPAVFLLAGIYERTAGKYGTRAKRYVWMEAGHAAQNLLLQATALGLGGVPMGAFDDNRLRRALGLPTDHRPLYVIPIGEPSRG